MTLSLLFPIGVLIAGATSKVWVRVRGGQNEGERSVQVHWREHSRESGSAVVEPTTMLRSFSEAGIDIEVALAAPSRAGRYLLDLYGFIAPNTAPSRPTLSIPVMVINKSDVQGYLFTGTSPLSYAWGSDRGVAVHRLHLEQFLAAHSGDITGRCLEFQEPRYVRRFGGSAVRTLDILHQDATNPRATLVADLTQPNALGDSRFDCIVCTHVLQSIFELEKAMAELHRILAPGGVLLVGVPQVSMSDSRYGEFWRFTPDGLLRLVTTAFAAPDVTIAAFGNSLTSAGELRGVVASEFSDEVLSQHDSRFAAEICARAVKR